MAPSRALAAVALAVVTAACTAAEEPAASTTVPAASTTSPTRATTTVATAPATTTTEVTPTTAPPVFRYAVVAEERARRLAVLDPTEACLDAVDPCRLEVLSTVALPARPHNLAAHGSIVYATHPGAGTMSRVDIGSGAVVTAAMGREPHDVKYSPAADVLYVADEAGRSLLTVDPDTLEVIDTLDLPARPHDLAVAGDVVWVTLIGRDALARVTGGDYELVTTGGSPHDLIVDGDGLIWFSNWNSDVLNVFDPADGSTVVAPAGVVEPHHFAIDPGGTVWVSDNGGSGIVGFSSPPVAVAVGPVPHHLAFAGETAVVAVSGSGEAVFVREGRVAGRSQLSSGLHGVAIVALAQPLNR